MPAVAGIPNAIVDFVQERGFGANGFVIVYVLLVMLLGITLDSSSILLIAVPITTPIAQEFGFDLVHFSIITGLVSSHPLLAC